MARTTNAHVTVRQRDVSSRMANGTAPITVYRGASVPSQPTVSVCILLLDDVDLGRQCLDALRLPGGCPSGTELVVVANGTSPDRLDGLGGRDDLVLVVSPVNLGFGGGCNLAADIAGGTYLVFLNDDSQVQSGCIGALVDAASSDPAIGAIGSCLLSEDGTVQEAGSVLWRDGSAAHVGAGSPRDAHVGGSARDVDFSSANGLLVRHEAWDLVGGFDERYYPAYFEDVDLCLALAWSGFRVRYEPRAKVVHLGSQSTSPAFRAFLLDRNHRRFVDKWKAGLDRFDPRPLVDEGPAFDAAVARAVSRTASRIGRSDAFPTSSIPAGHDGEASDASTQAASIEQEYREYLERTVVDSLARVGELQRYIAHRPDVRCKRWVRRKLNRRRL